MKPCLIGFLIFGTLVFLAGSGIELTGIILHHVNGVNSVKFAQTYHDARVTEITKIKEIEVEPSTTNGIDHTILTNETSPTQQVLKEQGTRVASIVKSTKQMFLAFTLWTWFTFGIAIPSLIFIYIGIFKRKPFLALCGGYVFFFFIFSTLMLVSAQITNHLLLIDVCEQVSEILYEYNYPSYGTGIGYYSSCLP